MTGSLPETNSNDARLHETPRGTRDFPPAEMALRNHVGNVLRRSFESFGFRQVQTPTFESFELFAARAGEEILESMFTFASDAGRYALRPELTSPVCRMAAAGKFDDLPQPHRLYYSGSCFRYCRPQVGRWREFEQVGVEMLGAADPLVDAEAIALAVRSLVNLGIPANELRLRVGNVGIFRSLLAVDGSDERVLTVQDTVLHDIDHVVHLSEVSDEVAASGELSEAQSVFLNAQWRLLRQIQKQTKYDGDNAIAADATSPVRDDWTKLAAELPAIAETTYRHAWKIEQDLPDDVIDRLLGVARVRGPVVEAIPAARTFVEGTPAVAAFERLEAVCNWLEHFGVTEFNIVLGTVRNLDFYTGTVFEIDAPMLGEKTQICGGGRYDGLVERLGGPSLPATGFAFGFDRLVEVVRSAGGDSPPWATHGIDVFVTTERPDLRAHVIHVANRLRGHERGLRIACELSGNLDGALEHAARTDAKLIAVVDSTSDQACAIYFRDENGQLVSTGEKLVDDIPQLLG